MKKFSSLLTLTLAFVILLAGCSQKSNTPANSNTPQNASTEQNSDSKDENTLDKIKKAGKIVIGTGGNYRPFNYMNEKNELVGFDIEWGNIIAEGLGVKAEFITGQFSGLTPGLLAGKFDILLAGVNVTDERKKSVDFAEPYGRDGVVAVVNKEGSNNPADINDLQGKVVGVIGGATAQAVVKGIGGYKEIKEYPGGTEVFKDLVNKRVDLVSIGQDAAGDYLKNSPDGSKLEIAGEPYTIVDVAIPLRKNNAALKEAIDKIILEKKQDGTYQKLAEKYFGFQFDK
ncbi:substrate-binding periplasmic protein [Paenibacillus radicis (ex Gao et al. 2016)]|uniref:Amino acid ABC transporter substrate-binding protein n=1 Tax=Paenibacillus radicis (ex Gao et al. 2016) TaxID=1737354 RepID=A0A917HQ12_9BACL|nr:ABC transporter substrate-binding protein [Paenibacillus radicis (ex Gao et al. 2016)]GGG85817.1 amino acid ABC transporter substrate-binding protein [Paenibacillus radicis (ex Gao et al. 2016)]